MTTKSISEPNWLLITTFFLAGLFGGALVVYILMNIAQFSLKRIHPSTANYKFISPLLAIDFSEKSQLAANKALELSLEGLVDERIKRGDIRQASIYFRNIEAGDWFGINENEKFSPGIFLKIPIMIAYFKLAEEDPKVLQQRISVVGQPPGSTDPEVMQDGTYTVSELIEQMIKQSGEVATRYLFDNIDKRFLNEVYSDLGINFAEDKLNADFISTKSFALFFRVLHNSTYLSRDMSERTLEILSRNKNDYGMGAILPQSLVISHSKGYRSPSQGGYEMYDCGIVYYPQRPYLLCIMGRASRLQSLKFFFSDASSIVYRDVDYKYGNR